MALTNAYLTNLGALPDFLSAIQNAQAPERFTLRFLEELGFRSSTHRLFIPLLKGLKFLDDNGTPTQRYFDFLDDTRSKQILADAIRDAYEDLFRVNVNAHKMSRKDVAAKLKSLTEGRHSQRVLNQMAGTFDELVKLADFESSPVDDDRTTQSPIPPEVSARLNDEVLESSTVRKSTGAVDSLIYRIEIVLPPVRDKSVYDAIFRSMKEHLL